MTRNISLKYILFTSTIPHSECFTHMEIEFLQENLELHA